MVKTREKLNKLLSERTGQPLEAIKKIQKEIIT